MVLTVLQFAQANPDRIPCQSSSLRHGSNASPTQGKRFAGCPLSAHPFVHQLRKRAILESDPLDDGRVLREAILRYLSIRVNTNRSSYYFAVPKRRNDPPPGCRGAALGQRPP